MAVPIFAEGKLKDTYIHNYKYECERDTNK